jgi:hypothetical protein
MISVTMSVKVKRKKRKAKSREIFCLRKLLANLEQESVGRLSPRNAKGLGDVTQKKKSSERSDHDE